MSAKLFEKETIQPIAEPSENITIKIIPQTDKMPKQETLEIPSKPVMPADAAAYPKLLKIYKELNRQSGIIFDAERERNELELERDSLKGLAKLTKKGELQNRINRKNEEIDLLKVGLSGIVKRYGFQTVHDFYKAYAKSKNTYADYRDKADKWEESYGEKPQNRQKESVHKRLMKTQKEIVSRTSKHSSQKNHRGVR